MEGQPLAIVSLSAGRTLDRRLSELGLHVGSRIQIQQRRGPGLIIARDRARIAVGLGMAMKIFVVPV
jgi:ferrous iron transport protein A